MKKVLLTLIIFIILVSIGVFFIKFQMSPVSSDNLVQEFLITKGSSVAKIGKDLKKAGLIKNDIVFKFYVQATNSQTKIQAGEYELSKNLSLNQIVEILKKGPKEIWVTIPEGMRREEIALKFASSLDKDETFVKEFLKLTEDKEGYLFPDTYLFPKTASASSIVKKMTGLFDIKFKDVSYKELIIASLLERETLTDEEKPVVAGILYKRLENDWPLQVDATLQYIKGDWKPVFPQDKELKSPYNTYKNLGLPPRPISNPGSSSINASQNPEISDYWFYIHDTKGVIHYAKTIEEHNLNIRRYLN